MKKRKGSEELCTGDADFLSFPGFHSGCDGLRGSQQFRRWRQSQRVDAVTLGKGSEFFFSWWRIGEHGVEIGLSNISRASADCIFYVQELAQRGWQARHQFLPGEYLASGAKGCEPYALHDPIPVLE